MTEPTPTQYVVITYYQPPGDKPPVVHVWGPYPTQGKAITAKRRGQRQDAVEYGREADEITYWVRKILAPM